MPLYVKGEGGANVVLAWREEEEEREGCSSERTRARGDHHGTGGDDAEGDDDQRLRRLLEGRVLRVRKSKRRRTDGGGDGSDGAADADAAAANAEAASLLDALIWAPVAGASASAAERDEAFAHRVLAPALGPLLQRGMRLAAAGNDDDDALLLRAAAAATVGGGPLLLPPELLPDATAPLTAKELAEAAGGGHSTLSFLCPVGPPLCFELKPKSGARGRRGIGAGAGAGTATAARAGPAADGAAEGEAADAIRRSFSRFSLHALLKQQQQRQQEGGSDGGGGNGNGNGAASAAAAAAAPDDDGPPLYDPWRLFEAAAARADADRPASIAAAALEVAALLERPSNNLRVFRGGRLAFGRRPPRGGGGGGGGGGRGGSGCAQQALAGAFLAPGLELERAVADQRQQKQQQQQQDDDGARAAGAASSPPPPRPLVAALVAAALLGSGALPALLRLQEADELGPEAAARLHASLLARVVAAAGGGGGGVGGGVGGVGGGAASSSSPRLPRLPARDLALMRAYGAAVTAKDASVMVTLQQVAVLADSDDDDDKDDGAAGGGTAAARFRPPLGALWPWPWPLVSLSPRQIEALAPPPARDDAEEGRASAAAPAAPASRAVGLLLDPREERPRLPLRLPPRHDGGGGGGEQQQRRHPRWLSAFAWRARVVDTDLKPAAKARAHAELERRCLAHALGGQEEGEEEGEDGEGAAAAASGQPRRRGLPPRLRRYAAERDAWRARWDAEWRASWGHGLDDL